MLDENRLLEEAGRSDGMYRGEFLWELLSMRVNYSENQFVFYGERPFLVPNCEILEYYSFLRSILYSLDSGRGDVSLDEYRIIWWMVKEGEMMKGRKVEKKEEEKCEVHHIYFSPDNLALCVTICFTDLVMFIGLYMSFVLFPKRGLWLWRGRCSKTGCWIWWELWSYRWWLNEW